MSGLDRFALRIQILEWRQARISSDIRRLIYEAKALSDEDQELRCEILALKDEYEAELHNQQNR